MSAAFLRLWIGAVSISLFAMLLLASRGAWPVIRGGEIRVACFWLFSFAAYQRQESFGAPVIRASIRFAHGVALLSLIAVATILASYAAAQFGDGFRDEAILQFDRMLGFDWVAVYNFERKSDLLTIVARFAYGLIDSFQILLVLALVVTGQEARLVRFIKAYVLVLCVAVAIFALLPMESALMHLVGEQAPYMPCTRLYSPRIIAQLQDGTFLAFGIDDLTGIITFPSVHAAAAILYIWAFWTVRVYRYPMLILNLLMLAATPIEGTHYLTDVIGGCLLAITAIMLVSRSWFVTVAPGWTPRLFTQPVGG